MTALDDIDDLLGRGGVCILPTETVYGLAGRADNAKAIDKIYEIKGRDFDKPLAVCVRNIQQARAYGVMNLTALTLAGIGWPGPLTLVVSAFSERKLDPRVYGRDEAGNATIALRLPRISWASEFFNMPLALTSANKSGERDSYTAQTSINEQVDAVLNEGPSTEKIASTILAVEGEHVQVLRKGALGPEAFAKFDIDWTV